MQKIIFEKQQVELLRKKGEKRLTLGKLAEEMNITRPTLSKILNDETPLVVTSKVYDAVNNWLAK